MATNTDVPENANEHCPGTESDNAGKSSACDGCPNQDACKSGPKGPDPAIVDIKDRLSTVKHKVLVLSGKGGVGKSTVSSQLAFTFAASDYQVGLLDIDICGPSIPQMMGLRGEQVHQSNLGWSPVYVQENLAVMSIGFLLQKEDQAIVWRGPRKNEMIKQFLKDVNWDELDILLVDTPPGTSDEHLSVVSYLKEAGIDGAIIVTTPQEVSLLDVRKEITFCKKTGVKVLGVVENMSGFVCPGCKTETQIFKPTTGGAEKMASDMGVPFLGRLPLDPTIRICCDSGKAFMSANPDSPASKALGSIVERITQTLKLSLE